MFMFFSRFINVSVVAGSSRHSWLHRVWFWKIKVSKIKDGTVEIKQFLDAIMDEIIIFLRKYLSQPKLEPLVVRLCLDVFFGLL